MENVVRGVRHAAICDKCVEGGTATREFFGTRREAELWTCPTHGVGRVQENKPYAKSS